MKSLICICCPKGCHLSVDEVNKECYGYSCKRGKEYGLNEVINPTRTITSTVAIRGASLRRAPVKTSRPIPKGMIMDIMAEISRVQINAPIKIGDVIIENVLNTGADIIATRDL